jgi:hypothetical protein
MKMIIVSKFEELLQAKLKVLANFKPKLSKKL